jgi:hypothetical protein
MKRYPRIENEDDGLGSLLDTMTNVVGILVLVLIATQLGVKDAVDRISESDLVTPEALEQARETLKLTAQQRDILQTQLRDSRVTDSETVKVKLQDLRRQRDAAKQNLQQEQGIVNQFAVKLDGDKKKAATAKKTIADSLKAKEQYAVLSREVTQALEEEARLKALLSKTPVQKAPPAKIVTLPDPRPAPKGVQPLYFLCTRNRVFPIADDDVRMVARKQAELIVKGKGLFGGPEVGVNKEGLLREFAKVAHDLPDKFFKVELYASGIYPRLRFIPSDKSGASLREIRTPRSRFHKMLNTVDPRKYYARFVVLPDSYEVYLAAREVMNRKGVLAGWDPQAADWQFTTHLGGSVLFGPKPPPPKPNPNPPKTPPRPQNVID